MTFGEKSRESETFWLAQPMRVASSCWGEQMGKSNHCKLDKVGPILPHASKTSRFGFRKGQSTAEFAMVSFAFFLLVFAVIGYAYIFFAQMNIQQAIDDGGRFASTGSHTVNVKGVPTTLSSRMTAIEDYIQNEISIPGVNVAGNIVICDLTAGGGGCNNSGGSTPAGNPGDTVKISLTTPLKMPLISSLPTWTRWFPGGTYNYTSSTTFKNEPFDPSQSN
jgi:hypothetical protein